MAWRSLRSLSLITGEKAPNIRIRIKIAPRTKMATVLLSQHSSVYEDVASQIAEWFEKIGEFASTERARS
jgi:hypothetical protein